MRRYSILSLMGLVLALAMGFAALRIADDSWAGGLLLATPMLLGIALIGGLCGAKRWRARRLGFTVIGSGYFALAFLGLSEGNLGRLSTSKLLRYVHAQVAPQTTARFTFTGGNLGRAASGLILLETSMSSVFSSDTVTTLTTTSGAQPRTTAPATVKFWRRLFPGAGVYEPFSAVGHRLFALLAGLIGAVIAWRCERERLRAGAASERIA